MPRRIAPVRLSFMLALVSVSLSLQVAQAQTVQEVATGLRSPAKLLAIEELRLVLVAEAGNGPNTGRITALDDRGGRCVVVDGLPSGFHGNPAAPDPTGPSGLAWRDGRLFVLIGNGDVTTQGAGGSEIPNPQASSPLFSSILVLDFDVEAQPLACGFTLAREAHDLVATGGTARLLSERGRARLWRLVDLPDYTPEPRPDVPANVRISNPFGIVGNDAGFEVNDAARNLVWRVDVATRTAWVLSTFAAVPNTGTSGPPVVEAVPASIRAYGDDLLVSFLTGFPFGAGAADVRVVNRHNGTHRQLLRGLQTAIDVLPGDAGDSAIYVLEFSANLLARAPGRLLRFDTPSAAPVPIATGLSSPTSLTREPGSRDLLVTDFRGGRVLRVLLPR